MKELLEFEITVNEQEVLAELREKKPAERIIKLVRETLKEGNQLIKAKAIVKEFQVVKKGKTFVGLGDKDGLLIESKNVAFLLKDCEKASVFACTISSDFKTDSKDLLKAVILDAIGSVAVEKLAEKVNKKVKENALKNGFKVTQRYSCGFADWQLSDQTKILKLLDTSRIGLKVNNANILIPRKSITAIIGRKKE